MKDKKILIGTNVIILLTLIIISTIAVVSNNKAHHSMHGDMSHMRDDFIMQKNQITGDMLHKGMYRCCLEKPCTYCIEKTPGHGEGAICDCLKDLMDGVHPCGECIGEILEGHGNPLLSEYFARAIAEKTGHENTIKQIIFEKYGIPVKKQL